LKHTVAEAVEYRQEIVLDVENGNEQLVVLTIPVWGQDRGRGYGLSLGFQYHQPMFHLAIILPIYVGMDAGLQ
jgi:hypothetical protein